MNHRNPPAHPISGAALVTRHTTRIAATIAQPHVFCPAERRALSGPAHQDPYLWGRVLRLPIQINPFDGFAIFKEHPRSGHIWV